VGIVFKGGVVLGADTRATGGSEVVDKNCEKIHYIAPNIWCCGAGTAADTEKTTELIASNLELLRLSTRSQSRVVYVDVGSRAQIVENTSSDGIADQRSASAPTRLRSRWRPSSIPRAWRSHRHSGWMEAWACIIDLNAWIAMRIAVNTSLDTSKVLAL
jgi:hypothetical protein